MPTQAEIQAAIDRFESGYYNSDPYDAATNPGGLAADGHDINLPALLVDAGRLGDVFALLSVTSTTQLTIDLTQKTLTLDHARGFLPGASVVVAADAGNWMFGQIDAYDEGVPSLTFTPSVRAGSGTFSSWTVQAAGAQGASISWRGDWAAGTAYAMQDAVYHKGSAWIANQGTDAGDEPGVSAKWDAAVTGLNFRGAHSAGTYRAGDVVTAGTGPDGHTETWRANTTTTDAPGGSADWDLLLEAGADGPVTSVNGQTGDVTIEIGPTVDAPASVTEGQSATATITNYDSEKTYTVSATHGSVSRSGADITYTAPAYSTSTSDTLTVNGNGYPITVLEAPNKIGDPGTQGFGVGEYPGTLPAGFSTMTGTADPASDNYGNYQYSDGSVLVFVPAFYYRIGDAGNPTYGDYGVNSIDVQGVTDFADEADANAAGYVLHRAFKDGGATKSGFFIDKYLCSPNGGNDAGLSVKDGVPISLTTSASYTDSGSMSGCDGQLSDAVVLARARGSGFNCASAFMYSALAMLALAHAQAATGATECAWYDSGGTTNYPKGCNSSLGDVDDAEISYTTAGDSGSADKPLTGSGAPFAKTTHNGQTCGVCDINGCLWQVGIGVTVPGSTATASSEYTSDLGVWMLDDSVALADLTGGHDGANDAWQSSGNIDSLYTKHVIPIAQGDAKYWGNSGNDSLSGAQSGDGYVTDSIGLAVDDSGVSAGGTNLFGQDYHRLYRRENLVALFSGYWSGGANAGVFSRNFNVNRSSSSNSLGFRAAAYGPS